MKRLCLLFLLVLFLFFTLGCSSTSHMLSPKVLDDTLPLEEKLLSFNIPLTKVLEAVKKSNRDVEGRVLEFSGAEYMVRGRGYIRSLKDIEDIAVGSNSAGTPIYVRDVAQVSLGPEIRRGLGLLDEKLAELTTACEPGSKPPSPAG
jgi:hypothetical protein